MCEVLGVNRTAYYRWLKNNEKRQLRRLRELDDIAAIEKAFNDSDRIWGYRNICRQLKAEGREISEYRVRRLMKENGFYPELAVKFKPYGKGNADGRYFNNIVKQEFDVREKNKVWAGDITYIKTSLGWCYLAVVKDLYNREIVGYEVSKKINTDLVKEALGKAIDCKGTENGLIFHSDRGCQYASKSYQQMLEANGISGSMSRAGCPYDNSCVESFFASLKKEKIYRKSYDTMEEVKQDVFWYIEIFYNRKRRHSKLDYMSPIEYRKYHDSQQAA